MSNTTSKTAELSRRKPYHTPRMDDYGYVNQLTQTSGTGAYFPDSGTPIPPDVYTSVPT